MLIFLSNNWDDLLVQDTYTLIGQRTSLLGFWVVLFGVYGRTMSTPTKMG